MNSELTQEQQQALDRSPGVPVRVTDSANRRVEVLLRGDDFDWVRELLGDEPDTSRRIDPRTGIEYAVLTEQRYERFKAFFEEDPLSLAERRALLREAGQRAGWHTPEWNDPGESS